MICGLLILYFNPNPETVVVVDLQFYNQDTQGILAFHKSQLG